MNAQSWKYLAAVAAAIIVPYQVAQQERHSESPDSAQSWWGSMWQMDGQHPESPEGLVPDARASNWESDALGSVPRLSSSAQNSGDPALELPPRPVGPAGWSTSSTSHAMYPQAITAITPWLPFSEILRFDVTPSWVVHQFPQVWKQEESLDRVGYRVTLMSGLRPTDIVGALTYVFDARQTLQCIQLDGRTADPSEIALFVSQYHGLRVEPEFGPRLLISRGADGQPLSALCVEPIAQGRLKQPQERFHVNLELNRPGSGGLRSAVWNEIRGLLPSAEVNSERSPAPTSEKNSENSGTSSRADSHPKPRPRNQLRRPNTDRLIPHSR